MCRYPAPSAARTASRVSSGGVWKTPRPSVGICTPLLSSRVGVVAWAMVGFVPLVSGRCGNPVITALPGGTDEDLVERHAARPRDGERDDLRDVIGGNR